MLGLLFVVIFLFRFLPVGSENLVSKSGAYSATKIFESAEKSVLKHCDEDIRSGNKSEFPYVTISYAQTIDGSMYVRFWLNIIALFRD